MKTTFVLLLLFGLFSPAFGLPAPSNLNRFDTEDDCEINALDGAQKCHCGDGRKISWVTAEYNSGKKDRTYEFRCTDIPGNVGGWSGDSWYFFGSHITEFDQALFTSANMFELSAGAKFTHNGVEIDRPNDWSDYFLIGVESTHKNTKEDRAFQLFYAMSTKYRLEGCTWLTQSEYFKTLQVPSSGLQTTWGGEKVFREVESRHKVADANGNDGGGKDRIWKFQYCNIVTKCPTLTNITYGEAIPTKSSGTTVNSKVINNLDMSYAVTSTIEITEANTESISESYTFGASESSEIGASLEISQSFSYGVPTVGEGETSITASLSSLFSWESNWERSSSQEYGKEHSTTMSWEITCPSRCYCERSIEVEKKTYKIPYTMVSTSSNKTETCKPETGTVTVDLATEAELTGGDYTNLEKTERCTREEDKADAIEIYLTLKKEN